MGIQLLAGLPEAIRASTATRAVWGTLLGFGYFVVFDSWRPWAEDELNTLSKIANVIIFLSYFMAFVVLAEVFSGPDLTIIGIALILLNVSIVIGLIYQQQREFKEKLKMMQMIQEVSKLQSAVVGIGFVRQTLTFRDRRRFFEDFPIEDMSDEQKAELARALSLKDAGIKNEEERVIHLKAAVAGLLDNVKWYWNCNDIDAQKPENQGHIFQDPATNMYFLEYAENVTAQYEARYQELANNPRTDPVVVLDLEGRVVGSTNAGNGLNYQVNVKDMLQTNVRSGFQRQVLRREVASKAPEKKEIPPGGNKVYPDTRSGSTAGIQKLAFSVADNLDTGLYYLFPDDKIPPGVDESKIFILPPFPRDLMGLKPKAEAEAENLGEETKKVAVPLEKNSLAGLTIHVPCSSG